MLRTSLIITSIVAILFYFGLKSFQKKTTFNQFADVEVLNPTINFGTVPKGEPIQCEFKIHNNSDRPFIVINIVGDKDLKFNGSRIKKLVNMNEATTIFVQLTSTEVGEIRKSVIVESNSKTPIQLKIIGKVF